MGSKILILAVCLCASVVQSNQINGKLTKEQIQKLFHRNEGIVRDLLAVPNYESINIQSKDEHRSKRETRPVEFEIDGEKIQLNLNPATYNSLPNYIPVYTVESTHQAPYHTYRKLNQDEYEVDGILYQDPEKLATLLAYYKDGYIYYDGVFGESRMTKVVRSLPEKWWTRPDRNFTNDHIVYNVETADGISQPIYQQYRDAGQKLDKPLDILYPKLLVVIENTYFQKFGSDVTELLRYLSTFWNSVNLQYNKLSYPKVKIMVTGVIIAKDDLALRYIYNSRNQTDMSTFHTITLLNAGGEYFRDEFNKYVDFKNYDSTITLLALDSGPILGSAYMGQICGDTFNVGFMRDDASYDGLQPATHEIGHLLDLPHDETDRAKSCKAYPEDNISTVMAAFVASVDKYIWSECSKNILREFAGTKGAECMKEQRRY